MFLKKDVLKICSNFTVEHLCRSVISIKLLCNFIEITLRHRCSPVNLLHIFRNLFSGTPLGGRFRIKYRHLALCYFDGFLCFKASQNILIFKGIFVFIVYNMLKNSLCLCMVLFVQTIYKCTISISIESGCFKGKKVIVELKLHIYILK